MKMMMAVAACALFALETKAGDAPKATLAWTTYKLRDGREVAMSASQLGIANKRGWSALAPESIATLAASITVTINVDKNDGTHMFATVFFIDSSEVVTNGDRKPMPS